MKFLRQSTASQVRTIGPFVDDTDGKTAETGLTIAATDIKLMINGAASVNKNSGGGTHRVNGHYSVTFNATDTATVGEMTVSVVVAGALPYWDKFFVLEESVFDSMFGASAAGPLTSLGANAPANWLNAAGIAAGALDGKGDWATAGDAMTLTSGERSTLAAAIESAMINEGDATALLQAIADKIADANIDFGDLTAAGIASAVWANQTRTLTANPGLDAAGIRSALGMTAANLDTKIAEILAEFGNIEGGGSGSIDPSDLADALLPLLITALRPFVIDANLPQVSDAGTFALTARDDYADNEDIQPIGPIRIQTPLALLRESNPPRLRFGATQRIGSRLGDVKFIGSAFAVAVDGEDDLYDVFIEIPKSELNRAPGAYSWDVEAVFPAGFVSTLFGGLLTLNASMGDNEERDPLNPE